MLAEDTLAEAVQAALDDNPAKACLHPLASEVWERTRLHRRVARLEGELASAEDHLRGTQRELDRTEDERDNLEHEVLSLTRRIDKAIKTLDRWAEDEAWDETDRNLFQELASLLSTGRGL